MQIDKQQVIELIRERGDSEKVQQAMQELPEKVDLKEHSDLLARYGIDPQDLLSKAF
jgi:hypothetical protein